MFAGFKVKEEGETVSRGMGESGEELLGCWNVEKFAG